MKLHMTVVPDYDPSGSQVKYELPRNDEDGMGVSIYPHPSKRASVVVEVFNNVLQVLVWDGDHQDALYGDDPQVIVIADDYDEWAKRMDEKE